MTSSPVSTKKSLKGLDSRKSQSWWWDGHIGSRNSKWFAENVEEMEQNYKRMLKLIEGDGDSFAKKAEMYYQRRPELLSHVEEFYRMYKLLAERYEHLTGELRKNLLPDLQANGFLGSDIASEATSVWPYQDPKISHRRYSHRAAGFDFFLGSGRSGIDRYPKGDETPSISDSETESDVSSLHSYPGILGNAGEEGLHVAIMEPDVERYGEKLQVQQAENNNGSLRIGIENFDGIHSKSANYEEELKLAKEKIYLYEEEITNLKLELQKFTSLEFPSSLEQKFPVLGDCSEVENMELEINDSKVLDLQESINTMEIDVADPEQKILMLVEDLRLTKMRLQALNKEVIQLRKENNESSQHVQKMQDILKMARKDAATFKKKLEIEKRQASKLQERLARYKASLIDRENEVRELKEVISDANRKYQLHAEISRLAEEKTCLEEKLREWEVHYHSLEMQNGILEKKLNDEIENLKADIAEKTKRLEAMKSELDAYKIKCESLMNEKDELNKEISIKKDEIIQTEKRLQQVAKNDGTLQVLEKLRQEVERQKILILEGAEGKREAIRQLCFSLDHYRKKYQQLRQAFPIDHKQHHVLAS